MPDKITVFEKSTGQPTLMFAVDAAEALAQGTYVTDKPTAPQQRTGRPRLYYLQPNAEACRAYRERKKQAVSHG